MITLVTLLKQFRTHLTIAILTTLTVFLFQLLILSEGLFLEKYLVSPIEGGKVVTPKWVAKAKPLLTSCETYPHIVYDDLFDEFIRRAKLHPQIRVVNAKSRRGNSRVFYLINGEAEHYRTPEVILNNLQIQLDTHVNFIFISSIDKCIETTLRSALFTALGSKSNDLLQALTGAVNNEEESLQELVQFRDAVEDKNASAQEWVLLEKLSKESLPEGGVLKALARGVMAGLATFLAIIMFYNFAEKFGNKKKAYNR